jgi:probable F420-dependent oxidoreductase
MKLGLMFANVGPASTPEGLTHLAERAESAGLDSLWAVEHAVIPAEHRSRYPYSRSGRMPGPHDAPLPDPLLSLAFCAAVTHRIRLATGVLIAPLHHPAQLAKRMATLDHLSRGRAILGAGIGWLREEMLALGVAPESRASRADEVLAAVRALWTTSPASFSGEHFHFAAQHCEPRPLQPGGIPIVIGGHSPGAARRAARLGDGFFPYTSDLEHLSALLRTMRRECARRGRDPRSLEITCPAPDGPLGESLGHLEKLRALGVARVTVHVLAASPSELDRYTDAWDAQARALAEL